MSDDLMHPLIAKCAEILIHGYFSSGKYDRNCAIAYCRPKKKKEIMIIERERNMLI